MMLVVLSLIIAPANLLPDVATGPDGPWVPEGSARLIDADDQPVLMVTGDGDDTSAWLLPVEVEPGGLYRMSFEVRGTGTGGCAVTGFTSVNHDIRPSTEWQRHTLVLRAPDAAVGGAPDVAGSEPPESGSATVRLGQWHWQGEIRFRDVALQPAAAVHTGYRGLGIGERIERGRYVLSTDFSAESGNDARPLQSSTATFNTHRYVLGGDSDLVYRFHVPGTTQTRATIQAEVGYHVGGRLVIEASADGESWVPVAELAELGSVDAELPEGLLPADELWVRLSGSEDANLQLYSMEYAADLDDDYGAGRGGTVYVSETKQDYPIETRWVSLTATEMVLAFSNGTRSNLESNLVVELDGEVIYAETIELPAVNEIEVTVPLAIDRAGDLPLRVTLGGGRTTHYEGETILSATALDLTSYGHGIVAEEAGSVWWCTSTRKVSKTRPPATESAEPPHLAAARGEYEALQIVLRADQAVGGVELEVSDLTGDAGTIDARHVAIEHVEYVEVTRRTDASGVEGAWPDPLPPYDGVFDLTPGENHPLWIRVFVPRDAAAGEYSGSLRIAADAGPAPFDEPIEVPLSVRVYDFELPEGQGLTATFGLSAGQIWQYHNVWEREDQELVWDLYMRNFAEHRIAPYDPMALWPIGLELEGAEWSVVERDPENPASGTVSAKIVDDSEDVVVDATTLGAYPVDRDEPLLLEWSVRTAEDGQQYQITIGSVDPSGSWIPHHNIDILREGSTEWRREQHRIAASELVEHAVAVELTLRPAPWSEAGEATGTAWFDDIFLGVPGGENLLADPGFEPGAAVPEPVLDFEQWDRAAEEYLDGLGFNSFRLPVHGMGSGTFHSRRAGELGGYMAGTPEYEQVFGEYAGALQSHLEEKGWLDDAYVYWFDEPDPKDYDFVIDGMERLDRHAPGLRRMLTEQVEDELVGHVDIWCPLTASFQPYRAEERMDAGDTFWWYVCTGPKAPWVTLFIDHPATELRVWSWQTYKHGVEGLLVWQSNYWTSSAAYPGEPQNPWEDPMSYVSGYSYAPGQVGYWGNGDGRFLYPPNRDPSDTETKHLTGPVNSLRWEMLRDGIEDYEYLRLLERLATEAGDAEALALLEIPEDITESMTEFATDPAPIYEHRQRVAEAIERLSE